MTKHIHSVFHEFVNKFGEHDSWSANDKLEMINEVSKWAKQYPKDVFIDNIDDASHASSNVIFILHRNEHGQNWGTTAIVITQCDAQKPLEFFMYPGHLKGILKTLAHINELEGVCKDD